MTFNKEKQQDLFFIIGLARSGTSILHEIMNTFNDFCNVEEARVSDDIWSASCYYAIKKNNIEKRYKYQCCYRSLEYYVHFKPPY